MNKHGLGDLPVIANMFAGDARRRHLLQPYSNETCAAGSGVCKCAAMRMDERNPQTPVVFVGDGRSDFCVSAKVDFLFAKSQLLAFARAQHIPHFAFDTFHDVTAILTKHIGDAAPRVDIITA